LRLRPGPRPSIPKPLVPEQPGLSFRWPIGHAPERVDCPGDLAGRVGEFERCAIADNGKRYNADVTVTAVNGNRITTHEAINEEVSPPPSRP
jgi:hypothetical protein